MQIEKAEEICPGRCIKLKKYNSSRRLIAELLAGRSRNIEEDVELQTIIASLPKGVGLKIYGMDQLHLNESPITIIL